MRFTLRKGSPGIAAILSFLLPGLGQAASGRVRRALIVAIPALAAALFGAWFLLFGPKTDAISIEWLTAFLVVDLVAFAYHAWAIVDAYLVAGGRLRPVRPSRGVGTLASAGLVVVLLVGTVGVHGALGAVDLQTQDDLNCIFNPEGPACFYGADATPNPSEDLETTDPYADATDETDETLPPDETDTPSESPSASPSATGSPSASPTPKATPKKNQIPVYPLPPSNVTTSNWAADNWLNVVLVGADAGVGRWSLRTDTMILLRVDLSTGRAAMFGIPRNVYNVPLGPASASAFACHCFPYPNMLNALYRYATDHPEHFPGTSGVRGFKALEAAFGALTKVPIDGSVVVNLMGFVKLVDALGGVNVNVPYRVKTLPQYPYPLPDGSGTMPLDIAPGMHHFNGNMAEAFARARHVIGYDSDYYRMARQQLTLVSIRNTISHPCSLASKVSSILSALKGTLWTDLPLSAAPQLLGIAEKVGSKNTARYTLVPPAYAEFYTQATVDKIRNTVAHGLDKVPAAGSTGGGGASC